MLYSRDGKNLKCTVHLVSNLGVDKHYDVNNHGIRVVKYVPVSKALKYRGGFIFARREKIKPSDLRF